MDVIESVRDLADLVGDRDDLYVRYSQGPAADRHETSRDELTRVPLPGLSANALVVEPWWDDRSREVWMARRLYDYQHLRDRPGERQAWVLRGRERGRGPDNEPLVVDVEPIALVAPEVIEEARRIIVGLEAEWGSLDRQAANY